MLVLLNLKSVSASAASLKDSMDALAPFITELFNRSFVVTRDVPDAV